MKRQSTIAREESYEHVLMCLICRSLFDDHDHQPKFLPCHHTFCKDCLREYVLQMGDDIECPSCRQVTTIPAAGVTALQTNFYIKYIQGLVHGSCVGDGASTECSVHAGHTVQYYCKQCNICVCKQCCNADEGSRCGDHDKVAITTITEECHHRLDTSFSRANAVIESKRIETEALLRALSQEKDDALKRIDAWIEQHVHTLHRRGTLLKNKVIDVYNEHVTGLEADLEEISTAMTCIVSLKEYNEQLIGRAQCKDIDRGIVDIDDVYQNINAKINPTESHIVFEDKHGVDKFKMAAKDLGRVRNSRPMILRAEPEGGRDQPTPGGVGTPQTPQESDSEASPLHVVRDRKLAGSQTAPVSKGGDTIASNEQAPKITNESCDTKPLQSLSNKEVELASNNNGCMKQSQTGEEKHPSYLAARPKCFDTSKRQPNPTKNQKAKTAKPHHFKSASLTHSTGLLSSSHEAVLGRIRGRQALVPTLRLVDPSRNQPHPTLPDLDALKKADKMYHHLVYTSYDEEELLSELKSGKMAVTDPNLGYMA